MLKNKYLISKGYLFVKDINPHYLKTLIDLEVKPIFIYIHNNIRTICIGIPKIPDICLYIANVRYRYIRLNNIDLFNLDICHISEIKYVLENTMISPRGLEIENVEKLCYLNKNIWKKS